MVVIPLAANFAVTLDDDHLVLNDDLSVQETKVRTRAELEPVSLEPHACVPADAVRYLDV